jgi:hypothetical protein
MTTTKSITITMSETAPIKIDPAKWPKIADASNHDGHDGLECRANTKWSIIVREHEDGRRIVYGWQDSGPNGQYAGFRPKHAGYLVALSVDGHGSPEDMRRAVAGRDKAREEQTIRAIRLVAGVIGDEDLGAECVGDLPAQEI